MNEDEEQARIERLENRLQSFSQDAGGGGAGGMGIGAGATPRYEDDSSDDEPESDEE